MLGQGGAVTAGVLERPSGERGVHRRVPGACDLESLLKAYLGTGDADAFVITADTRSRKTEAAALPLIAGAAIDRLAGREG